MGTSERAMKLAKELEEEELPSDEEIVRIYKEGLEEAAKLNKLLKPAWFIRDPHSSTRKKKSL